MVSKIELLKTSDGRKIFLHHIIKSKGSQQVKHYKRESERYFAGFVKRFTKSLYEEIKSDKNPVETHYDFVEEVGFPQLAIERTEILTLQKKLSKPERIRPIVYDILNTDFIKMVYYILIALFDGTKIFYKKQIPEDVAQAVIDGHIIAIDLSEPMDRVIDEERPKTTLKNYKFLCPYILKIGREKISKGGKDVLDSFERGFKKALKAEKKDEKLVKNPHSITYEKLEACYAGKYEAIMGTAARNMSLGEEPIASIYYHGMAKAGCAGGCRNEIMDSRIEKKVKLPSWPLLFARETGDIRKAFELTHRKGRMYLEEAKIAGDELPDNFPIKPFIKELFYFLGHEIDIEYKRLLQANLFSDFENQLKDLKIIR